MKVLVISGGTSLEWEISRISAQRVVTALQENHEVASVEFDSELDANLHQFEPEVVFPVLHGVPGEDGSIQGYLEVIGMPFVGSGMNASALAIDKFQAKCVWREHGLPVLPMKLVHKESMQPGACEEIKSALGNALVIKPRAEGSALGVKLLPDGEGFEQALTDAFACHDQLLIEPFVKGREITVGVLEDGGDVQALPIIEIQVLTQGEWYDFTNRYKAGASRHVIDPAMSEEVANQLRQIAINAHQLLGCRDFSRVDFILTDQEEIHLLEINTIPGMTPTSLYPDAAKAAGIEFGTLIERLLQNAVGRPS